MKNWLIACGFLLVCGCGGSTGNDGAGGSGTGGSGGGVSVGGTGGTNVGGSGGAIPPSGQADKVDLLVMVDNSISMADKQIVLSEALPGLVNAFSTPPLDGNGQPAFKPVTDIHFGVITSSLGSHGGDICSSSSAGFNETQNDKAHLIAAVRPGVTSYQDLGFLWWDPVQKFGGESDPAQLLQDFQSHVVAAGEQGCGYEASLESWYRFLVDPNPPEDVTLVDNITQQQGTDQVLLQQRQDFLRPDSLVIIVVLSDENDCSMIDAGQNWIFAQASSGAGPFHLPPGTSACATDPNSVCCRSCATAEASPPAGCSPIGSDPACQSPFLDDQTDHLNLRCWNQMQRFGVSNLHPTRRYVDALTRATIQDREGNSVANPLFVDSSTGQISRAQNMVMFVPIVGVPWQDLATTDSLSNTGLTYLTSDELTSQGRWSWILPQCKHMGSDGVCDGWDLADQPDDPMMIESQDPRTGVNPATNAAVAPPSSSVDANPINGHEFENFLGELQYACTFELEEPRDCSSLPGIGCDCPSDPNPTTLKNPLCQAEDGTYSTLQRRAKAYPGTRQLQVAKDLGANAVVGSVCPKSLGPTNPAHAYVPVVDAVARQLVGRLVK